MTGILERLFGPKAECESCRKRFTPRLQDSPLEGGGVRRYFACPRCGQEYGVAVISERGLEIIELLKTERRPVEMQALLDEMKTEVTRITRAR